MPIISTPQTIERFVESLQRALEAGIVRPVVDEPIALRTSEVFVLHQLVHELGVVYAGTPLGDLAVHVRDLLHERFTSAADAADVAAARTVKLPLTAHQLGPHSSSWRVDDSTGRAVGLISDYGIFSTRFTPTRLGQQYDVSDLVRIGRPLPRELDDRPTLADALTSLEQHIRALAAA